MGNRWVKPPAMKRTILQLVVALCVVGSIRADQTIQSGQHALTDQGFYYGNVTGEKSAEPITAVVVSALLSPLAGPSQAVADRVRYYRHVARAKRGQTTVAQLRYRRGTA